MKYITLIALLALTGCMSPGSDQTTNMITICLDNVSYWYGGGGGSQMMAVRIDPKTLQPMLCK